MPASRRRGGGARRGAGRGHNGAVVTVEERQPTPDEYAKLRRAVGWVVPDLAACEQALAGTQAAVCVVEGTEAVGMGRLVGDGGFYLFIVDVVMAPAYQGRGFGRQIVAGLVAVAGRLSLTARVNLVAAGDVAGFYERLGFTDTGSVVMEKRWEPPPSS